MDINAESGADIDALASTLETIASNRERPFACAFATSPCRFAIYTKASTQISFSSFLVISITYGLSLNALIASSSISSPSKTFPGAIRLAYTKEQERIESWYTRKEYVTAALQGLLPALFFTVGTMSTMVSVPSDHIKESASVLDMSPIERKALAQGPLVKIFIDNKCVSNVRRNLLVAASTKGASFIDANDKIHLSSNCTEASVGYLVDWLNGVPTKNKIMKPRLHRDVFKAINAYHAAEELGMVMYVHRAYDLLSSVDDL